MKRSTNFLLTLVAVILVSLPILNGSAGAAVIYDNGGTDYSDAFSSDFGIPIQSGDDFSLNTGANVITDIHWWGFYFGDVPVAAPPNDAFTIRIFNIVSGVPATNPLYENIVGSNVTRTYTGDRFYEYSVDVSPVSLTPGASYLLSIVNDSTKSGGGGYGDWFWSTSQIGSQIGDHFYRFNDGDSWATSNFELAFNLTGPSSQPVPEPSTFLLLGAGLAGLGFLRRRAKK